MDDPAGALIEALDTLKEVAATLSPDEAVDELDAASLQLFWREWPGLGAWAGAVWRRLNEDLEAPSATPQGHELQELGGSG